MQPPFSSQEVEYLFEYALENRRSDAAGLALKAATVTNADSCALLSKAIEKSKLLQMSLANGLTHFARYDQLDLVINLLKGNSSKIKLPQSLLYNY
jgi:hypothetical protein